MIVCCGISIVPRAAIIAEERGRGPLWLPPGHTKAIQLQANILFTKWLLGLTLTSGQFWEFTRPLWISPGHNGSTFMGCSLPVIYHVMFH